ncbi:uncharacterized protein LOC125227481 [Leguminivora glycinivorella]|uniref:uncharacterized protein LOC125227481 n=1 Tax=Leguminivora glycinivorella TaxID=1035111 RepID=UPI00200FDEEC|nr:uncharacterized protein LOC125227481 [Leguminivora glycinivorella]
MSPLACSLIALAALFAVSNAASVANPFCDGVSLGDSSLPPEKEFKLTVSGGDIIIPNRCKLDRKLVGQSLSVCNTDNSMPEIHPNTIGARPYEKVFIDCPKSTRGCEDLELKVTQYCLLDPIGTKG